MSNRRGASAFALLVLFATEGMCAELVSMQPVWTMVVRQDNVFCESGKFGSHGAEDIDGFKFPLPGIVIRKVRPGDEREPVPRMLASVAYFGETGALELVTEQMPAQRVSEGLNEPLPLIVAKRPRTDGVRGVLALGPDASVDDITQVSSWQTAPNGRLAIVQLWERTLLIDASTGSVVCSIPINVVFPRFSENGQLVSYVMHYKKDGSPSHSAFDEAFSRVVVTDRNCEVSWQSQPAEHRSNGFFYPYLSPRGEFLAYSKQSFGGAKRMSHSLVVVDLATGQMSEWPDVPFGGRYYSRDGRWMLVIGAMGEGVFFYSLSPRGAPTPVWSKFQEVYDVAFGAAAVSDDGSWVALELRREGEPKKATVLSRSGLPVASYVTDPSQFGLTSRGPFLIVGIQDHPVPASKLLLPTTRVDIFFVPDYVGRPE